MKNKYLFLTIIQLFTLIVFQKEAFSVPAYPHPFKYIQPDGSTITIKLKGDEKVHWAESLDGYTLLSNGKNGWEYAVRNPNGDIKSSGFLAHEKESRNADDIKLLQGISKELLFSSSQVEILKSFWEIRLKSASGPKGTEVFNPNGTKNLVMILIGYTDMAFSKTQTDFDGLMNQIGYNLNGAVGSVKDFFLENSYNHFNVTTTVAGPYTAAHNMAYYGSNDPVTGDDVNSNALITEAVNLANPDVNYADFDNDGDGGVDGVYVIYAGYAEAAGGGENTIWPHAGNISTVMLDGKSISKYSCSSELRGNSGSDLTTIGVICHEFGHVCGSPDYYDTDYSTGGQYNGTGDWDLMAGGSWGGNPAGCSPPHMVPIEKVKNGWIVPILLTTDASFTLNDITTNPVVFRYNTTTSNEYFLLENRQRTGFNASVPGHGLMIYHVDGNYISTAGNCINCTSHQGMFPMSAIATNANGVHLSSDNKINKAGCPWPGTSGKTTFTDATTPNAKDWAGNNTNGALINIAEAGGVISLCYKSCPAINPVSNLVGIAPSGSQIDLGWMKNAANNDVILAWNSSNSFGNPASGTTYNVNDVLAGGGTILYKGPASSFNHTGLSPSTTYYYRIWSMTTAPNYSDGTSSNAQTLCASVTDLPFYEGFEGGVIPGCWTQTTVTGTNPWEIQTRGTNYHPAAPHSGTYLARCRTLTSGAGYVTKLISPPINLTGNPNPVLKFWHTQENWDGAQDIVRVFYRTSGTSEWNLLYIYTSSIAEWTLETIALPNPSANYFIAFEATVNAGYSVCIDDVEILPADCVAGTWLGTISNDWFTPANWCGSFVPGITTDVVIPSGTRFSPSIAANGAVCRNITINNSASLSMSAGTAYTFSVKGDWTNKGTFTPGLGIVDFNGTNDLQTIGGSSTSTFNILKVTKGAQSRILEVTSPLALSGSANPLVISSGTFKLSSSSTITPFTTSPAIWSTCGIWNNGGTINAGPYWQLDGLFKNTAGTTNFTSSLIYNGSASRIEIGGGNVNFSSTLYNFSGATTTYVQSGGTVTVNSSSGSVPFDITSGSTFNMIGGYIIFQKAASSGAVYDYRNLATTLNVTGGTLQIGNASTTGSPTIRINSTAPVFNIVINATGTPKAQLVTNGLSVVNDVTINTGTSLLANNLNLSVGRNWTNNGTFTPGTSIVTFNGAANQDISGSSATTFKGLTMNNSAGATLSGSVNATVDGVFTLTSGVITTGNNKLILTSNGSVSRTSGHVYGNLQKNVGTGTNVVRTFEIGDAASANYTPVSLTFASVGTAGNLLASTTSGDHANIALSTLNTNRSVNRFWSITNGGVGFSTYDAVFNFLSGDLDASANTAYLTCGKFASSSWTYPTVGTKSSTSTQITGVSALGDIQLAEGSKSNIAAGGNWSAPATWSPSGVPVATDNVLIASPGTVTVDIDNAVSKDLTVQTGAALQINPSKTLSVNGNLSNSGTFTIESNSTTSSGSLIVSGTSSGNVTFNRQMRTDDWHYFSSPVGNQSVSGFKTANPSKVTKIWSWEENAEDPWVDITSGSGNFISGRGYNLDQDAASNGLFAFTGTVVTSPAAITTTAPYSTPYETNRTPWGGGGWNLLGNPFTSAMIASSFISTNSASFDPSYQAVYIYDGSSTKSGNGWYYYIPASGYTDPFTNFDYDSFGYTDIQVGQGFFVLAKQNDIPFTFDKSWQTHNTTVPLKSAKSNEDWFGLRLKVKYGENENKTAIVYNSDMTVGLDPGYDIGLLSASPDVEIYTSLVKDNGVNFTRQALPLTDIRKNVIPVGLDSEKGGQVTFSADIIPIEGYHFFLEDRMEAVWHNLDTDTYTVNLPANTKGTGRFFIRAAQTSTGIKPLADNNLNLSIWCSDKKVNISGQLSNKAVASVYDLSGRKIFESRLNDTFRNSFAMPPATKGIYLIKVVDGNRIATSKVIF